MYEAWQQDPKSVHISWNEYFRKTADPLKGMPQAQAPLTGIASKDVSDNLKVLQLINAYQLRGHEMADLDPLRKSQYY
jgi:2-oxoglutarate dehydrogenase E1 component